VAGAGTARYRWRYRRYRQRLRLMPAGGEMASPTGRQEESLKKGKNNELGELQNQLKNCLMKE
jgi:hypothetical protein